MHLKCPVKLEIVLRRFMNTALSTGSDETFVDISGVSPDASLLKLIYRLVVIYSLVFVYSLVVMLASLSYNKFIGGSPV